MKSNSLNTEEAHWPRAVILGFSETAPEKTSEIAQNLNENVLLVFFNFFTRYTNKFIF